MDLKKKKYFLFLLSLFFVLGFSGYIFYCKKQRKNQSNTFLSVPSTKKSLRVLTYSSFSGIYGPGRIIKKQFEAFCKCKVHFFLAEDSTALLQRFSLVSNIDVVIGWDQISIKPLDNTLWEDLSLLQKKQSKKHLIDRLTNNLNREDFLKNPHFIPLDWSPIGFLYRGKNRFPDSLQKLHQIQGKISFPEPRTSTLGLQFYYWIYQSFQGNTKKISDFLKQLKNKVYGPVFSWSLAYGFFQKGQTDMGLSYLSSLIYHQKEQKYPPYFFARFKEGHPYQVEFFSVSKKSKNKKQALEFGEFLISKDIQKLIQETHYMFAVSQKLKSHPLLDLQKINLISYKRLNQFINRKKDLLELWENSLH